MVWVGGLKQGPFQLGGGGYGRFGSPFEVSRFSMTIRNLGNACGVHGSHLYVYKYTCI